MIYADYKPLVETLRRESFSRQQLAELLSEVVSRICHMQEPELEKVQHDLSESCEEFDEALDEVDARESQFEEIEL